MNTTPISFTAAIPSLGALNLAVLAEVVPTEKYYDDNGDPDYELGYVSSLSARLVAPNAQGVDLDEQQLKSIYVRLPLKDVAWNHLFMAPVKISAIDEAYKRLQRNKDWLQPSAPTGGAYEYDGTTVYLIKNVFEWASNIALQKAGEHPFHDFWIECYAINPTNEGSPNGTTNPA